MSSSGWLLTQRRSPGNLLSVRRSIVLLVALAALTACVSQSAPDRTPLPNAAEVVAEPAQCQLLVGEGQGVRIEDVIADTGADGVLQVGDIVVSVDGQAVASATDLRRILGEQEVGSTITVTVEREGSAHDESINLGPNPEAPERPMLGVMISTAFSEVAPGDVTEGALAGSPLSRSASIGGRLFAFDPLSAQWISLNADTPVDNWIASDGRVLTLANPDQPGSSLIDVVNQEELTFEIGDWNGSNLLGTLGAKSVVSVTRPVDGEENLVEIAVMLVDFAGRNADWIWPVTGQSGIPLASFPAPDASQLVLVGEDQESGEFRHVLLSAEGALTAPVSVPTGFLALGWFDDEQLLVGGDGLGLQVVDLGGGSPTPFTVPTSISTLRRVWPVGDGTHILGHTANSLVRFSGDPDAEVRTLADNCQVEVVGDLGWSA